MIFLDDLVKNTLKESKELKDMLGSNIYYPNEPVSPNTYNAIIYGEVSNVPAFGADEEEKTSRITYQITIYREKELTQTMNIVEKLMKSINFIRHSTQPVDGELPAGVKGRKILFIIEVEVY